MNPYLNLLEDVLTNGTRKGDRTGTGTLSVFGRQVRFDLSSGFPLLTTKRLHLKSIIHELLWFISGSTNIKPLVDNGVSIWTDWPLKAYREKVDPGITREAFEALIREDAPVPGRPAGPSFSKVYGKLGPVYGKQWRDWEHNEYLGSLQYETKFIDQLQLVLDILKADPDSRRMIISAWNVGDLPKMALAPCHCLFQFNTREMTPRERFLTLTVEQGNTVPYQTRYVKADEAEKHALLDTAGAPRRKLDLHLTQRSADIFLGVPFNIASYALFAHLGARHCGMVPGDFVHSFGDLHLYSNHVEQAREQLGREPRALPTLSFREGAPTSLFDIRYDDIVIEGYDPHPGIKAPVAV